MQTLLLPVSASYNCNFMQKAQKLWKKVFISESSQCGRRTRKLSPHQSYPPDLSMTQYRKNALAKKRLGDTELEQDQGNGGGGAIWRW